MLLIKNSLDIPKRIKLLDDYPMLLPIFTFLITIYQLLTRRYYKTSYPHSNKADKALKIIMSYGQPTISTRYSQIDINSIHYEFTGWCGIDKSTRFSEGIYTPEDIGKFTISWLEKMPNRYITYLALQYIDYWREF